MPGLRILAYALAFALYLGFFLFERFVRKGEDSKNMNRTAHDHGSY